MDLYFLKETLDTLYTRFNNPAHIHPDPLEFVYHYPANRDREVVALLASSLAYGRVQAILRGVNQVLTPMGDSPTNFILSRTIEDFKKKELYGEFVYRFTRGEELVCFLSAIRRVLLKYGTLRECFLAHDRDGEATYLTALSGFVLALRGEGGSSLSSLLPDPRKGSAMKRINLFLRWMIRHDAVDPGTWCGLSPARLVIPLDTHLHAFGLRFGLTRRKGADLKTALEITEAFRELSPQDPIRYDFALAHRGILGLDAPVGRGTIPVKEENGMREGIKRPFRGVRLDK